MMRIKRETLDDAIMLRNESDGAIAALGAVRAAIEAGEHVIVDEYDGSTSLLTLGNDGKFKSTPIAPE